MSTPTASQTPPATRANRLRAATVRRTHLPAPVMPVALTVGTWSAALHFDLLGVVSLLISIPSLVVIITLMDRRMHARYPQTIEQDNQITRQVQRRRLVPGLFYGLTHFYTPMAIAVLIYVGMLLGVVDIVRHFL